jgi:hypothetical protein
MVNAMVAIAAVRVVAASTQCALARWWSLADCRLFAAA